MRRPLQLGVVLCCLFLAQAIPLPLSNNGQPQYLITLPKKLLTEVNHTISVEVSKQPTVLRLSINGISWVKDYALQSTYEKIYFRVPSQVKGKDIQIQMQLNDTEQNIFTSNVTLPLVRRNVLIIAETSKPIYKPGELVQFRFLPVFMSPDLRVAPDEIFNVIRLEDPDNTLVLEKRRVPWQEAMNMSYALPADTKLGVWKLRAVYEDDVITEEHSFRVDKYVLPKFTVDVKVSQNVYSKAKYIPVKVCAQYGTGKPMRGTVHTEVAFKPYYDGGPAPRLTKVTTTLSGSELCPEVRILLNDLLPKPNAYGNLNVAVKVVEDGTGESVTKNVTDMKLEDRPYKVEIEGKSYFRRHFPYYFTVKWLTLDGEPLPASQLAKDAWWTVDLSTVRYWREDAVVQRISIRPNAQGIYQGRIVVSQSDLRMNLRLSSSEQPYSLPQKQISQWKSSGPSLQIVPLEASNVACIADGVEVRILVQSNVKFGGQQLKAHVLAHGRLQTVEVEVLGSDLNTQCQDRNDDLGHFRCLKGPSGALPMVKCLEGYSGERCTEPVCPQDCSGKGSCIAPGLCMCRPGFSGKTCEVCTPLVGCKNGNCVEGNDCVCKSGWTGPLCELPIKEFDLNDKITTTPKPTPIAVNKTERPTEVPLANFEQTLRVRIQVKNAADLHLVVFAVVQGTGHNFSEIIADQVEIPGVATCLEKQRDTRDTFRFSRPRTEPGANLTLILNPPRASESCCSLRISDVTLTNFGTSGGVTLRYLLDKLMELNHQLAETRRGYLEVNPYDEVIGRDCKYPPPRPPRPAVRYGYYGRPSQGTDSGHMFESAGLFVLTNLRFLHRECSLPPMLGMPGVYARGRSQSFSEESADVYMMSAPEPLKSSMAADEVKVRIREFFPETWRFDYMVRPQSSELALTAPDSITTWNADAYCMTPEGLWIGATTSLTVGLPFYVEPSLPYSVKKGEALLLPIKVISYLAECFEIRVSVNVSSGHLKLMDAAHKTLCMCGENTQKTIFVRTVAVVAGRGTVEIVARSTTSSWCEEEDKTSGNRVMRSDNFVAMDAVRRPVLVEHEGVPTETVLSDVVCLSNSSSSQVTKQTFQWDATRMVPGSLRGYLQYGADLVGPSLSNLGQLIRMPYGCGEQNMISLVPSIYVLDYLKKSGNSKEMEEIRETAKRYIALGYQRQLQYQHPDGSFSAFGPQGDKKGSTWLTAFVLRSFLDAQQHVEHVVSQSLLDTASNFLTSRQDNNGCFQEQGAVHSSGMKGAMQSSESLEKVLLTAYILISLKNSSSSAVQSGFSCLKTQLPSGDLDTFSLALLSYAYAVHPNSSRLDQFLRLSTELWKRRENDGERKVYFNLGRNSTMYSNNGQMGNVETTSYAYLALTSREDLFPIEQQMKVVRWLNGKRNSFGGYSSTQDTIVALKAVSQFSTRLSAFSSNTNVQLSMRLSAVSDRTSDRILEESKMVTKKVALTLNDQEESREIKTEVQSNGAGCFFQQSIFLYNTFQPESEANASSRLTVSHSTLEVSQDCKTRKLLVCFAWNGNTSSSGTMMLLRVKLLSGWILNKADPWENAETNRPKLEESKQDTLSYYFDGFTEDVTARCLQLTFQQSVPVEDMKPSTISVVDYYAPEVNHEIAYTFPSCNVQSKINTSEATTPTPLPPPTPEIVCPKYFGMNVLNASDVVGLQTIFYEESCQGSKDFIFARKKNSNEQRWVFSQVVGDQFLEWEEVLIPSKIKKCEAGVPELQSELVIVTASWRSPKAGYPVKLDEVTGAEVWSAKHLGQLLLAQAKTRCSAVNKFARMLTRIKSQIATNVGLEWKPNEVQLAEWECPLMFGNQTITDIPARFKKQFCQNQSGKGAYYEGTVIEGENGTDVSTGNYQEWQVTLKNSLWSGSGWNVTLVMPKFKTNTTQRKQLEGSKPQPCSWLAAVENWTDESRTFSMFVAQPWKFSWGKTVVDGDFGFADLEFAKKLDAALCKVNATTT